MSIIDVAESTAAAPVYVLRSLEDFKHIPPTRLGACLRDFLTAIDTSRKVEAAFRRIDPKYAWPISEFRWKDDGESGPLVEMIFHLPNGEKVSLRELMANKGTQLSEHQEISKDT